MVNALQCQGRLLTGYKGLIKKIRKIILALDLKISDKKKVLGEDIKISAKNRKEMRSGIERRQFSYDFHIPERRSGRDLRSRFDRKGKSRISD